MIIVSDIFASLIYIFITLFHTELCREVVDYYYRGPEFVRIGLQEFIATFELCTVCYELGIVVAVYGKVVYAIMLYCFCIWFSLAWINTSANATTYISKLLAGTMEPAEVLGIIALQLISGSLFFNFYLIYVWHYFQYGTYHIERMDHPFCRFNVHTFTWLAALIEGGAVCALQLIALILHDVKNTWALAINTFISTIFVLAAFTASGGFFNPNLATSIQFGCEGTTTFKLLAVYWVGPILGSVLAYYIGRNFGALKRLFQRHAPAAQRPSSPSPPPPPTGE